MPHATRYTKRNYRNTDGAKALRMVKSLKKATEVKHSTRSLIDASVDNATVQTLISVAAGTTDTTRVGDKIGLRSLRVKGLISAIGSEEGYLRLVIIKLGHATAAAPAVTDIFDTSSPQSFYKLDTVYKFKTVYDQTRYLQSAVAGKATKLWNLDIRVPVKNVIFDNDGTVQTNNYYLFYMHTMPGANVTVTGEARLSFTDS